MILALTSALAACHRPDGEWLVDRIDDQPVTGKAAVVTFRKGRVSAGAGCNGLSGGYRVRPGAKLEIVDINMTLVACMGARGERSMALEELLGERLGRARTFARRRDGTLLVIAEQGRLLLRPRPAPVRAVEGDWTICRASPPTRMNSEPLRVVRFHDGVVDEWAGCRGSYSLGGSVLRTRFDPTPKCRAAVESARRAMSVRDLPGFGENLPGPDQALLAAVKPNRVAFTHAGVVLMGAPGTELHLCKADPADLVPRSAWTLSGDWIGRAAVPTPSVGGYPEGTPYRLSFRNGVVDEIGGCRGTYRLSGDRLALGFPDRSACRVDRAADGRLVMGPGRALLPALPRQARVTFLRYDTMAIRFADGGQINLHRPRPGEIAKP